MDWSRIDLGALAGWAIAAGLMPIVVAVAWRRRWRRGPQAFKDGFKNMPADWRSPSQPLPPRR